MTRRHRLTYVWVLSMAGAFLALHALDAGLAGEWVELGAAVVIAAACLMAAAGLVLTAGQEWQPPRWAGRFELVGAAFSLRCNQCDTDVLPPVFTATLPRVLAYAHVHSSSACERNRAVRDGGDTDRIIPPSGRPRRTGPRKGGPQ